MTSIPMAYGVIISMVDSRISPGLRMSSRVSMRNGAALLIDDKTVVLFLARKARSPTSNGIHRLG